MPAEVILFLLHQKICLDIFCQMCLLYFSSNANVVLLFKRLWLESEDSKHPSTTNAAVVISDGADDDDDDGDEEVEFIDSDDEFRDSDDSDNYEEGLPGAYYGGYGSCYICGESECCICLWAPY